MSQNSKYEKTIIALLESRTISEAAAAANIDRKTIQRYMKSPLFQKQLKQARAEAYDRAIMRIEKGATAAADCLLDIVKDKKSIRVPGGRVQAASKVLDIVIKVHEDQAILQALERIEQAHVLRGPERWRE